MIPRQHNIYPEPSQCTFYESWCTDHEKHALEYALGQVKDESESYIEIGCFEGRSTVFTANLIAPKELIAIDPFRPHMDLEGELVHYQSRDIESLFRHNINVGTHGNVSINKMRWEDYIEAHPDIKISFLYLDGPHTYENVFESLGILIPLMIRGGVMMGDDYDAPEVKAAVDDFFGKEMTHPESYRAFLYQN